MLICKCIIIYIIFKIKNCYFSIQFQNLSIDKKKKIDKYKWSSNIKITYFNLTLICLLQSSALMNVSNSRFGVSRSKGTFFSTIGSDLRNRRLHSLISVSGTWPLFNCRCSHMLNAMISKSSITFWQSDQCFFRIFSIFILCNLRRNSHILWHSIFISFSFAVSRSIER